MTLANLTVGQRFQFLDGPAAVHTFNGGAFPSGYSYFTDPNDIQTTRFDHPVKLV